MIRALKDELLDRYGKKSDRIRTVMSCLDEDDSVLDIGCVQHDLQSKNWKNPAKYEWLHADITRKCERVLGMDLIEREVEKMNEHGYEAIVGNAEEFSLNQQFDKIVAGELIEHLSNPGRFFESALTHLKEDGSLVITTPNPINIETIFWYLKNKEFDKVNSEHIAWFDPVTMSELASRYNFHVASEDTYGTGVRPFSSFLLRRLDIGSPLHIGGYVFELNHNE